MLTRLRYQPDGIFSAVALLVGTAIGAGIFALPYVISRSGYIVGVIYLVVLGIVSLIVNLAYGEIVLSTTKVDQLPGYVEKYLGKKWKRLALLSVFIGFYSALVAYIIAVGGLLQQLFGSWLGGSSLTYSFVFLALMAVALLIGLRAISGVDRFIMFSIIILTILFAIIGWPHLHFSNLTTVQPQFIFLPYGVVLFALSAASAVPDMRRILKTKGERLKTAIIAGSIIPVVVYLVFVTITIGISGSSTTESAVVGLGNQLGHSVTVFGAIFGILTMTTTFLLLGLVLKEVYQYDFQQRPAVAWLLVWLPPLVLVSLNLVSFIEVLGLAGAVVGGLDGITLMKTHRALATKRDRVPEYQIPSSQILHYLVYGIFALGIMYEVYLLVNPIR